MVSLNDEQSLESVGRPNVDNGMVWSLPTSYSVFIWEQTKTCNSKFMASIESLGVGFDMKDNNDLADKVHNLFGLEYDQGLIFVGCLHPEGIG